jgi:hypothetical protein
MVLLVAPGLGGLLVGEARWQRFAVSGGAVRPASYPGTTTLPAKAGKAGRGKEMVPMAKNAPAGDGHRIGAVRGRSQTETPNGHWVKRDAATGRFMDVRSDGTPPKGVRREK